MKKTLKIEVVSTSMETVAFKIVEQSHRGDCFGEGYNRFDAMNGVHIVSCICIEWDEYNDIFL